MDALPRYQNIPVTFDTLTTLYTDLNYENLRRSLGAVDDEKGYKWSLAATTNHVDGDTIPKLGDPTSRKRIGGKFHSTMDLTKSVPLISSISNPGKL